MKTPKKYPKTNSKKLLKDLENERWKAPSIELLFCKGMLARYTSLAEAQEDLDKYASGELLLKAQRMMAEVWDAEYGGTAKHRAGADADLVLGAMGFGLQEERKEPKKYCTQGEGCQCEKCNPPH